jgi:hypothetical protein
MEDLKRKIKVTYFPSLIELLRKIEEKLIDLLDTVITVSETSFTSVTTNVGLIKEHCTHGIEKLKEEIDIESMMLDEEVFLTFDKKYNELEGEKRRVEKDVEKFKQLHESFKKVTDNVERIHKEIYTCLHGNFTSSIYLDLKKEFQSNIINKVTREEIFHKILSDVKPKSERKSQYLEGRRSANRQHESPVKKKHDFNSVRDPIANNNVQMSNNISGPSMVEVALKEAASLIAAEKSNIESQSLGKPLTLTQALEKGLVNVNVDEKIIMRVIPNTKDVVIYDDNHASMETKQPSFGLFFGITKFLKDCTWINHNSKLWISGGFRSSNDPANIFLVYNHLTDTLTMLSNMTSSRANHSMIFYKDYIYAVGGAGTPHCERYDIEKNVWARFGTNLLSKERQRPILYVHKNYLYAFFGIGTGGAMLDSVERLNMFMNTPKWEIVPYQNPDKLDLKLEGCGIAMRKSDKELLFFGGKGKEGIRSTVFFFDYSLSMFSPVNTVLDETPYFIETRLIELGDIYYGQFDNEAGNHFLRLQIE